MFIRRTKIPELPVVLLEDTAALIGLVFAFAGVALSVLTGDGRWDGVGSLGIGALLATAAAILAIEMKSLLIGESAGPDVQRLIVSALEDGPELAQVIHLRTVHISPDALLVAAKVAIHETDSAAQITAGIDAAEKRVRAAVPIAKTIYLEPDIYHPAQADHTDPSIQAAQADHTHPAHPKASTPPEAPTSAPPPATSSPDPTPSPDPRTPTDPTPPRDPKNSPKLATPPATPPPRTPRVPCVPPRAPPERGETALSRRSGALKGRFHAVRPATVTARRTTPGASDATGELAK
jgi:hypothetical protein